MSMRRGGFWEVSTPPSNPRFPLGRGCRRRMGLSLKKVLTIAKKCSIIIVSSWQTLSALPLGNVSAYPLIRG